MPHSPLDIDPRKLPAVRLTLVREVSPRALAPHEGRLVVVCGAGLRDALEAPRVAIPAHDHAMAGDFDVGRHLIQEADVIDAAGIWRGEIGALGDCITGRAAAAGAALVAEGVRLKTVEAHCGLERGQVGDVGHEAAEDLSAGREGPGEMIAVPLSHGLLAGQHRLRVCVYVFACVFV